MFSICSPVRPNPIRMSIVEVLGTSRAIANLPPDPFFGATILPSGEWIPTPGYAGPEYMARLLNRCHEGLAVVVEVSL